MENQIRDSMLECGITPPEQIIIDANIHRFGKNNSCWYVFFSAAKLVRKRLPKSNIIICADVDENGIGLEKANEAAGYVDGEVVFPPDLPKGMTDFDDMVTARTSAYMCARKYGRKFETMFDRVGNDFFDLKVVRIK